MTNTNLFTRRTLAVAVAAALALYVGNIPQDGLWEEGMSSAGVVFAAGRKGGSSGSHSSGHDDSDHSHDDSDHSHDDTDHDHDDSDHDHSDSDDGHSSGKKGYGPKYRGGRSASGSYKGRGEGSRKVVVEIFEKEI